MVEGITAVSFDVTPFSSIWVLIRRDKNGDCQEINMIERIQKLFISKAKKQSMLEPIWFISQTSEKNYKDQLPKELVLRLLMIFSKENDVVLDPFSGNGITAIACKILKRYFICIEKNISNIALAQKRFEEMNKLGMFKK